MLDLRQTKKYSKYMEAIGWTVDGKPGSYAYIKKMPLIGNFIKIQHPERLSSEAIAQLIKLYKPFQMVIEPKYTKQIPLLTKNGYRQSRSYFVPSKTIQIDLSQSENSILKAMEKETRYSIKKAVSNKLKLTTSADIELFADFWQKCALKQRGMFLQQKKEITAIHSAFDNNAYIINVISPMSSITDRINFENRLLYSPTSHNDRGILSSVLMICTKKTAYYMYAASTPEGKKLLAPTLNVWEAIKLAKSLKKKVFDFEGIYDERFPIKSWQGFTRFKKSFGGKVIEYPGTFVKYRLPI